MAVNGEMELRSQSQTYVKTFTVYDGQDREIEIYTAPTNAEHGAVCTKVTMAYRNPTSTQVEKYKEERAAWDSSWDV